MSYLDIAKQAEARLRAEQAAQGPAPAEGPAEPGPPSAPAPQPAPEAPGIPPRTELDRLLGLSLGEFAQSGRLLAVTVPWWAESLWFVPTEADVAVLARDGVGRGAVWTARELADLLSIPGLTRDQARTVALTRLLFDGEVIEVRAAADRVEDPPA